MGVVNFIHINVYVCAFVIVWVSSYTMRASSLPLSDYMRIIYYTMG